MTPFSAIFVQGYGSSVSQSVGHVDDTQSVDGTIEVLRAFGCPSVRRAQGNPEFLAHLGPKKLTPDIIVGPLRGGEHPNDFYVDVTAPQGEYFLKAAAGNPTAAEVVATAIRSRGKFTLGDVGTDHVERTFLAPLNRKMQQYGIDRGSVLFGHVSYFDLRAPKPGVVLASHDYLRCVNMFLGFTNEIGDDGADSLMMGLHQPAQSTIGAITVDLRHAISFVAAFVHQPAGHRNAIFFVNEHVLRDRSTAFHPAVAWLRGTVNRCQGSGRISVRSKAKQLEVERSKRPGGRR